MLAALQPEEIALKCHRAAIRNSRNSTATSTADVTVSGLASGCAVLQWKWLEWWPVYTMGGALGCCQLARAAQIRAGRTVPVTKDPRAELRWAADVHMVELL